MELGFQETISFFLPCILLDRSNLPRTLFSYTFLVQLVTIISSFAPGIYIIYEHRLYKEFYFIILFYDEEEVFRNPQVFVILFRSTGGIPSCRFREEGKVEGRDVNRIEKPIYFCDVLKNTRLPIHTHTHTYYIYYKKGSSCFQNSSTRSESRGSTTTRRTRRRRCCPRATRILLILVSVLDRTN